MSAPKRAFVFAVLALVVLGCGAHVRAEAPHSAMPDDAWRHEFDPLVGKLLTMSDGLRASEVELNDIARIPDRGKRLEAVRSFEQRVFHVEAEALRIGLHVLERADTFLPTATDSREVREKTILVIESKILLVLVQVLEIKATIIIIKEDKLPPPIPPVPTR